MKWRTRPSTRFSYVFIALNLILKLPVTVASGEYLFDKLQIIKDYRCSNKSNEQLSGLVNHSMENEIAKDISYDDVI